MTNTYITEYIKTFWREKKHPIMLRSGNMKDVRFLFGFLAILSISCTAALSQAYAAEAGWSLRSETSIPLKVTDYCVATLKQAGQPDFRLAKNSLGQTTLLFTPAQPWSVSGAPVQILLGNKLIRQANITQMNNGDIQIPLGWEEKWLTDMPDQSVLLLKQGNSSQKFQLNKIQKAVAQLGTCIDSAWSQQPDLGGLPAEIEPLLRQANWLNTHILLTHSDEGDAYLIKTDSSYTHLKEIKSSEDLDALLLSKVDPLEPKCRGYFQSTLGLTKNYPHGDAIKAELACHYQGDPTRAWLILYRPNNSHQVWELLVEAPENEALETAKLVEYLETGFAQAN